MTKQEAMTLAYSIGQAYGVDAARAVELHPREWIVQLFGRSGAWVHANRYVIYVCWSLHDWERIPSNIKDEIKGELQA